MLRLGILGAGHFAERHLTALEHLSERALPVMVARKRLDLPFEAAEAAGAALVSPDALLESADIDAVVVCSPNHLHRQHTEAALHAGKHVFCEKPMALTSEDADAMVRTAAGSRCLLMVGHLTRHMAVYAAAGEILESGRLGKPRSAYASRLQVGGSESWRMDPRVGGGAPFDLLIHDFDLMNWYLGRPRAITARGHRHRQGAYEHLAAILTYDNGLVAVVEGGFQLRPGAGLRAMLRVVCERGHLEVDTTDVAFPIRVFPEGAEEEKIAVDQSEASLLGVMSELNEFIDAVEGKDPARLTVEDARLAVRCAALATKSADTAQELAFDTE